MNNKTTKADAAYIKTLRRSVASTVSRKGWKVSRWSIDISYESELLGWDYDKIPKKTLSLLQSSVGIRTIGVIGNRKLGTSKFAVLTVATKVLIRTPQILSKIIAEDVIAFLHREIYKPPTKLR